MGDTALSPTTPPSAIASWVQQDDKIPLLLAISLYTTPRSINDFILQPDTLIPRKACAWINMAGLGVIGIAGTNAIADLKDDQVFINQSCVSFPSPTLQLAYSKYPWH